MITWSIESQWKKGWNSLTMVKNPSTLIDTSSFPYSPYPSQHLNTSSHGKILIKITQTMLQVIEGDNRFHASPLIQNPKT